MSAVPKGLGANVKKLYAGSRPAPHGQYVGRHVYFLKSAHKNCGLCRGFGWRPDIENNRFTRCGCLRRPDEPAVSGN